MGNTTSQVLDNIVQGSNCTVLYFLRARGKLKGGNADRGFVAAV